MFLYHSLYDQQPGLFRMLSISPAVASFTLRRRLLATFRHTEAVKPAELFVGCVSLDL